MFINMKIMALIYIYIYKSKYHIEVIQVLGQLNFILIIES